MRYVTKIERSKREDRDRSRFEEMDRRMTQFVRDFADYAKQHREGLFKWGIAALALVGLISLLSPLLPFFLLIPIPFLLWRFWR